MRRSQGWRSYQKSEVKEALDTVIAYYECPSNGEGANSQVGVGDYNMKNQHMLCTDRVRMEAPIWWWVKIEDPGMSRPLGNCSRKNVRSRVE
jgi:hypothetical protein